MQGPVKCEYRLINGKNQSSVLTVNHSSHQFPVHDFFSMEYLIRSRHKVLTYIEYRAVSGVFRNIDTPPPHRPASVYGPVFGAGDDTLARG